MSVAIFDMQIANPDTRERIQEVINAESANLSNEYAVSIASSQCSDMFELWVRRPDGSKISMQLHADQGDLVPAVFRVRLRELLKLL